MLHALLDPCTSLTSLSLAMHSIEIDHLPRRLLPNLTSLCLRDSTGEWLQEGSESSSVRLQPPPAEDSVSSGQRDGLLHLTQCALLRSLVLTSPGLKHGLPQCWRDGWGGAGRGPVMGQNLTRLVLHGARLPWRSGQQTSSGLCCLSEMPQVSPSTQITCYLAVMQHRYPLSIR